MESNNDLVEGEAFGNGQKGKYKNKDNCKQNVVLFIFKFNFMFIMILIVRGEFTE